MSSVKEVTETFTNILEESDRRPRQLTVDKGAEFMAQKFQDLCDRYNVELEIKDPEDLNGLSRMDSAIAQLKRATRRLKEVKGVEWLDHLEKAATAYNKTPHGVTEAPPDR